MNLEIKINPPIPVITTFSMDKESDKIVDTHPELFQHGDEISNLSNADLRNSEIVTPYIKKSNILFIVLSVGSETSVFQAIEIYELARGLEVFTIIIAQMPSTLDSNEQHILAIRNMSELKKYVDSLLIFSSRSMSHSLNLPELEKSVDVIAPIRTLTEIILSDASFDLKAFQDSLSPGISYLGEGITYRADVLNAATQAVDQLIIHNEQALSFAKGLLIMITTATKLTTKELDVLSDYFNPLFTQYVEVTLLTPIVPLIKDQIRVTIICSGL